MKTDKFVPSVDSLREIWGTDAAYIHGLKLIGSERRLASLQGEAIPTERPFVDHDRDEQLRMLSRLVFDGNRTSTHDEAMAIFDHTGRFPGEA